MSMTHKEVSTLGGKASSRKKARAARQNARKPRPGRVVFNNAVRFSVEWITKTAAFDDYSRRMLQIELATQFSLSLRRIESVITTAQKRA